MDLTLALHAVAHRVGAKVAPQTATFMEYRGTGWKTNKGISPLTGPAVAFRIRVRGASPTSATLEIWRWHLRALSASLDLHGDRADFISSAGSHPIHFAGQVISPGTISGTLIRRGRSYPLVLHKAKTS